MSYSISSSTTTPFDRRDEMMVRRLRYYGKLILLWEQKINDSARSRPRRTSRALLFRPEFQFTEANFGKQKAKHHSERIF
jgi:hypothetical protein